MNNDYELENIINKCRDLSDSQIFKYNNYHPFIWLTFPKFILRYFYLHDTNNYIKNSFTSWSFDKYNLQLYIFKEKWRGENENYTFRHLIKTPNTNNIRGHSYYGSGLKRKYK